VWPRGQLGRPLLAAADISSGGRKCPFLVFFMVLAGWPSPGAKRQPQEGGAGWPDFDPDFAEEPITGIYKARFGVPPVGKKVFVQVNQVVDGWESLPVTFWAIVPAGA
jgi:hypothetical protein